MDFNLLSKAMDAVGLPVIVLDDLEKPNRIRKLHPTHKKCKCGFVGTKHLFHKHIEDGERKAFITGVTAREFWTEHGELPLNEGDI